MKKLYIKPASSNEWAHITTATTDQEIDSMMKYASYKVSYGYDIKIEHDSSNN